MVFRAIWEATAGLLKRQWVLSGPKARAKTDLVGIGITKPHIWRGRNAFLDVDLNFHMNNASYVYLTELARWNLAGMNGLLHACYQNKWTLMVGSQGFRYRRAIPPFAKYEIVTSVIAVDDRWMYLLHTFTSPTSKRGSAEPKTPNKVYSQALVRAIVVGLDGSKVNPDKVMEELGISDDLRGKLRVKNDGEGVPVVKEFLDWDTESDKIMKEFKI